MKLVVSSHSTIFSNIVTTKHIHGEIPGQLKQTG
jgi:hypothetical protein